MSTTNHQTSPSDKDAPGDKDMVSERIKPLLDGFIERLRSGDLPQVADYCARAGADGETLKPLLETLLSLESLRENLGDCLTLESLQPLKLPAQLDDFQLVRLVGRGGMGMVYEAVELSLNRRVALKLLDRHRSTDPRWLTRFHREAQAAARLHHTNILPVYASGEDQGIPYYAMQFVEGITLARLLECLLDKAQRSPLGRLKADDLRFDEEAIARSEVVQPAPSPCPLPRSGGEGTGISAIPRSGGEGTGISAVPRSGGEGTGSSSKHRVAKDRSYYRRVAEIGVQIADALDHALGQGVLHRDIKPSNVMLAVDDSVWVTDFGLARLSEAEDLTRSSEVIGTLRYLAPERLEGQHTIHGDLFGLGMILYELICLTPAFDAVDRTRLSRQVAQAITGSLRRLDPGVPADLETIVLKCIAPNPSDRYPDPDSLIVDLRLFIQDRPIASRRSSTPKLVWRWCQRNPITASLLSLTAALLMTVVIGSLLWAQSLGRERNLARTAEQEAVQSKQQALSASAASREAEQRSQQALELANRTEQQRKELLFRSLVDEMVSAFATGRSGQRLRGLEAAQKLLSIVPWSDMSKDQQRELRNATIASLSVVDIKPLHWLPIRPMPLHPVDVDPELTFIALPDEQNETELLTINGDGSPKHLQHGQHPGVFHSERWFSPSGRWLYEMLAADSFSKRRVWDWRTGALALETVVAHTGSTYCFHPDDRQLFQLEHAAICVYDLITKQKIRSSPNQFGGAQLTISPDGQLLVCLLPNQNPVVLDQESFEIVDTILAPDQAGQAAWDWDRRELLLSTHSQQILRWNLDQRFAQRHALGTKTVLTELSVGSDSRILVCNSYNSSEIIDRLQERSILQISGRILRISPDNERLALLQDDRLKIERLVWPASYQERAHEALTARFSPDGCWLAVAGKSGVKILKTSNLKLQVDLGLDPCGPVVWHPRQSELVTYGIFSHLCRWKLTEQQDELKLEQMATEENTGSRVSESSGGDRSVVSKLGPPQAAVLDVRQARLGLDDRIPQHAGRIAVWHSDGQHLLFADNRHGKVWQVDAQADTSSVMIEHQGAAQLAISPAGRLLAVSQTPKELLTVYDLRDCSQVVQLPLYESPIFSDDGKFLVCSSRGEIRVVSTGNWRTVRNWSAASFNFSRDSEYSQTIPIALQPVATQKTWMLLAAGISNSVVRLYDLYSDQPLADLTFQQPDEIVNLSFDSSGTRLAVVRTSSIAVWDLGQLRDELNERGIGADFLPAPVPTTASDQSIEIERGEELLPADRWWSGYQSLATFEAMQKNYADAIDNLDKALSLVRSGDRSAHVTILVHRAKYQLASQNPHQALSDLRQAQQLLPNDPAVLSELAKFLLTGPESLRNEFEGRMLQQQLESLKPATD